MDLSPSQTETSPPTEPSMCPQSVPENSHSYKKYNAETNMLEKIEHDIELDEEASQQMTTSYSEISFKTGMSPETEVSLSLTLDSIPSAENILQRPISLSNEKNNASKSLLPLNAEGIVHKEGNMTHFVTEDLEYKIKISSPVSKLSENSKSGTPSYAQKSLLNSFGTINPNILNDLEFEAQKIATSVDTLTENLCGILHSISSITADNVDIYKDAVSKMSDAMDANIKSMYTVMAKTEELSHSMKSVQHLASRIKELRRLVDLFESI